MIPVYQTKFHPEGNCLTACIASLLEIPLENVPHHLGNDWFTKYNRFLAGPNFNLKLVRFPWDDECESLDGYAIAVGPSPRGDWYHAVVHYNSELVHDPFEGGEGLLETRYYLKLMDNV